MAEMDGFEASRRIREREKQANRKHTPIVALSAHAPAEIRERCIAAGMDDVLAKPFREALLRDTLHSLIVGGNPPLQEDAEQASEADPTMPVDRSVLDGVSAFQGANGQLLLRNIVARFADTARTQLSLLRKSQSDGASEDVRRIAHTLKSSSAALGAKCVSRCCAEIELRASRGELAPLPAFLSALEEELSAAVGQLWEIAGEREELHRAAG
jgi:CheY-like chemotaxis protein